MNDLNSQTLCLIQVSFLWPFIFFHLLQGYIALAVLRKRDVIRRLAGILIPDFYFILRKFNVERGPNLINQDMKIVLDTCTQLQLLPDIIITPDRVFQPLLPFADTTFTQSTLISTTFYLSPHSFLFSNPWITFKCIEDVVGLVTSVYPMAEIVVHNETEN